MHEVTLLIDLDDEHLLLTIVVEDLSHILYSLLKLVLHCKNAPNRLQILRPPPVNLLLDHLALVLEIIEDVQGQHILEPLFTVVSNFPLQLQDSLKVDLKLDSDLAQAPRLVEIEEHSSLRQVSQVLVGLRL